VNAPPHQPGPATQRLEERFTSDPANIAPARKAVEALAAAAGFDDKAIGEIGLCVNEAMANVIRHAYGGRTDQPMSITAELIDDATALRVTIRDWGSGVNPTDLPLKPHDPYRPGGLGLVCLRSLMDQIEFSEQPDGMLLIMVKRKPKDPRRRS